MKIKPKYTLERQRLDGIYNKRITIFHEEECPENLNVIQENNAAMALILNDISKELGSDNRNQYPYSKECTELLNTVRDLLITNGGECSYMLEMFGE